MVHKHRYIGFDNAMRGLREVYKTERNFRIHILAAACALLLSITLHITSGEFVAIIVVITVVWVLELINSATERMVDLFKPQIHQYVKEIKDIMAAAVFVASFGAGIIGGVIFLPYIVLLLVR